MSRAGGLHWRARWLVRYFPGQAWCRLTRCRKDGHGPMLAGLACANCGGPWFGEA